MKRFFYIAIIIFFGAGLLFSQPSKGLENLIEAAKLIGEKEEEPLVKTLAHFQSEISQFNTIEQAIINSMIAECLWSYLQQNRYEIFDRLPIVNPDMTDVRTWDTRLLLQQCMAYYEASLKPREALQKQKIRDYKEILELGSDESEIQRPTLFDLLAFRAINAWSSNDLRLMQSQDGFILDNPQYFSRANVFKTVDIPSMDTLSLDYRILKTYQMLCQFHAQQNNPNVLIPLDLQRMAWVRKKAVFEHADSLYNLALQDYLSVYPDSEATAQLYWALAEFHNELGNRYNDLVSDDCRWDTKMVLHYVNILLERYAQTPFAKSAKALSAAIRQPKVTLQMQEVVLPDQHNLFWMSYANTDTVYFSLYRLSEEELKSSKFLEDRNAFFTQLASKQPFFKQWEAIVPNPGDYLNHRIELSLSPLPLGYYVLFASADKNISLNQIHLVAQFFCVSELALVSNSEHEKLEGLVLNRRTGKPVADVNVRVFSRDYYYQTRQEKTTELATLTTAKNGRFEYSKPENGRSILVDLRYKSDVLLSHSTLSLYINSAKAAEKTRKQLFLFTDRAVYRPGQTVYFKGILIERQGDEKRLLTDVSTTVKLFDANYKEVSAVNVKTNEYGSFSGQFTLPNKGLNGQYYLQNEVGSCYFSVEEYKRPSFEIVFDPLKTAYQLDKDITVSGVAKTYSGASLGQSTVKYKVSRSVQFPVWRKVARLLHLRIDETVITQGETVSDENGQFSILFTAYSDKRVSAAYNPTYTFTVTADVTDVSGETQQEVQRIPVSSKALNVSLKVEPYIDKTKDSVLQIVSTNLAGEKTASKGTVKVYRLIPDKRLLRDRLWEEAPDRFELSKAEFSKRFPNDPYSDELLPEKRDKELVFEKLYNTGKDSVFILNGLSAWRSGEYYYEIETSDVFGNLITGTNSFTVYTPKNNREPLKEFYYVIFPNNTFEPGEKASWLIGTASKLTVFYEIRNEKGVLERQTISLDHEQKRFEFPITEAHHGNLSLQIWCVKENRMYNTHKLIVVPFSNKIINLTFKTFRDKLDPNAQEKWTLSLSSYDKKPLKGELLLSMYDMSLDVFRKDNWNMDLNRYFHASSLWQARNFSANTSEYLKFPEIFATSAPVIQYDKLNFVPPYFSRIMPLMRNGRQPLMEGQMMTMAKRVSSMDHAMAQESSYASSSEIAETPVNTASSQTSNVLTPRTNLNETAFFYPFLRSDAMGDVSISFTVPESLTRWRIQGLAHTQDLKIGIQEWSTVTQKTLMLYPNTPRFLREDDQINFQAKIVNLSNTQISGKADLIVDEKNTLPTSNFSIAAQQNTSVSWPYRVGSTGIHALKFLAEAETHTDGEMRLIPVLSNRALLTETMPIFALPKSEQKYSFAKFAKPNSKTLENYRLTLEVATNPIWFAVQALPELSNPTGDNSIAVFGAYFANAMAMNIVEQNPKIKDVFNRWKTANSETLKSNLEINEDLKSVVLEETPWVLQTESETRQKQNIALYFDENNVKYLQSDLLARLKKLQLPNGGFAWYPGGRDDLWCTQYVVQGLQKMYRRDIERENFELKSVLQNALKYCDERYVEMWKKTTAVGTAAERGRCAQRPYGDVKRRFRRMKFSICICGRILHRNMLYHLN